MQTKAIDARGLKCPQPTLKVMAESHGMTTGDIIDVVADCATFEQDIRNWCQRSQKTLLWVRQEGSAKRCQVRM